MQQHSALWFWSWCAVPHTWPRHRVSCEQIKDLGVKAGIVLNPATPLETIQHVIPSVDLILLMSGKFGNLCNVFSKIVFALIVFATTVFVTTVFAMPQYLPVLCLSVGVTRAHVHLPLNLKGLPRASCTHTVWCVYLQEVNS